MLPDRRNDTEALAFVPNPMLPLLPLLSLLSLLPCSLLCMGLSSHPARPPSPVSKLMDGLCWDGRRCGAVGVIGAVEMWLLYGCRWGRWAGALDGECSDDGA